MKVADLFAKLGLRTDKAQFTAADRPLRGVRTALVGIVAFRTVRWFGSLVRDTAEAADRFNKTAQSIGIASEALQQLTFAANLSNVESGELEVGLIKLARCANDAAQGSDAAKKTFRDLRVQWRGAGGELRPVDALLGDLADRFAAMPDGTRKTATAIGLFGRSGAQVIPPPDGG